MRDRVGQGSGRARARAHVAVTVRVGVRIRARITFRLEIKKSAWIMVVAISMFLLDQGRLRFQEWG